MHSVGCLLADKNMQHTQTQVHTIFFYSELVVYCHLNVCLLPPVPPEHTVDCSTLGICCAWSGLSVTQMCSVRVVRIVMLIIVKIIKTLKGAISDFFSISS